MRRMMCNILIVASFVLCISSTLVFGIDCADTRKTLAGVKGVSVVVEELQPNIQKYAPRFNLTKAQLQKDIEEKLQKAGIAVFNAEKWTKTSGMPVLYVNVNTHEYEKYWYAFNIMIDFQQIVTLEANPRMKTLATTWDTSMTGIANIGTLNTIRNNVGVLIDRFIQAHQSVNPKK